MALIDADVVRAAMRVPYSRTSGSRCCPSSRNGVQGICSIPALACCCIHHLSRLEDIQGWSLTGGRCRTDLLQRIHRPADQRQDYTLRPELLFRMRTSVLAAVHRHPSCHCFSNPCRSGSESGLASGRGTAETNGGEILPCSIRLHGSCPCALRPDDAITVNRVGEWSDENSLFLCCQLSLAGSRPG